MDEDEQRAVELEKLDAMERTAWDVLDGLHPRVTNSGDVIRDPESGEPMADAAPALHALDVLLKIQERRAALLDLDAAPAVAVTIEAHADADAELARLLTTPPVLPPGHPEA